MIAHFSVTLFLLNLLFIHINSTNVLSPRCFTRIDSIAHVYYRGIGYAITSGGFYWIISEDDVKNSDPNNTTQIFAPSGHLPSSLSIGTAAVVKDISECDNPDDDEHSIVFSEYYSGNIRYVSYNITGHLANEPHSKLWSSSKLLSDDKVFGNADIDYHRNLDAMFNTDNVGEIFFIQGSYYSLIEFSDPCPLTKEKIERFPKQPLSDLRVNGRIDAAYYEPTESNPVLYLICYDENVYYKVMVNRKLSTAGKLIAHNVTQHAIDTHPILSKICAPNGPSNHSHLTPERSPINIASAGVSQIFNTSLNMTLFVILIFRILFS